MRPLEPGRGDQPVTETVVDRGPVTAGPVQRLVSAGVDAVAHDLAVGSVVVRDMARSAPRDALVVAKAGYVVARTVAPVARAIGDYMYDRAFGWVDLALADMQASAAAAVQRARGGRWFDMSGWARLARFRTRWEP